MVGGRAWKNARRLGTELAPDWHAEGAQTSNKLPHLEWAFRKEQGLLGKCACSGCQVEGLPLAFWQVQPLTCFNGTCKYLAL